MIFTVTDKQFLIYAARLSRYYKDCKSIREYNLLTKSYNHLFRQVQDKNRLKILKMLAKDRLAIHKKLYPQEKNEERI